MDHLVGISSMTHADPPEGCWCHVKPYMFKLSLPFLFFTMREILAETMLSKLPLDKHYENRTSDMAAPRRAVLESTGHGIQVDNNKKKAKRPRLGKRKRSSGVR